MEEKNSKVRIQEAFLELLQSSHIEKVSISDIIRTASVSRTTYYRYYYDQREILDDIINGFIAKLEKATAQVGTPDIFPSENLQYTLHVYLELQCYYENADLLRKLYKCDASEPLRARIYDHYDQTFDSWMTTASSNEEKKISYTNEDYEFYKRYSFSGNYDIIRGWINGGCKTPIKNMVDFITRMSAANSFFITVE